MPTTTYKIQTQLVTIWYDDGSRMPHNKSRHKAWHDWAKHEERLENVRDAVNHADKTVSKPSQAQWGCIVAVRRIVDGRSSPVYEKIYEAKIGTDGLPHNEFFGVAGDYWRRELAK